MKFIPFILSSTVMLLNHEQIKLLVWPDFHFYKARFNSKKLVMQAQDEQQQNMTKQKSLKVEKLKGCQQLFL